MSQIQKYLVERAVSKDTSLERTTENLLLNRFTEKQSPEHVRLQLIDHTFLNSFFKFF